MVYFENTELNELWTRLVDRVKVIVGKLDSEPKYLYKGLNGEYDFENHFNWFETMYFDDQLQAGRTYKFNGKEIVWSGEETLLYEAGEHQITLTEIGLVQTFGTQQPVELNCVVELVGTKLENDYISGIHNELLSFTGLKRDKTTNLTPGDYMVGIARCVRYLCSLEEKGMKISELVEALENYQIKIGDFVYQVEADGSITITKINVEPGQLEVNIPGTYNGYPIKKIGENALYGNLQVKKIIIGEGVEVVAQQAFRDCNNVNTLILPSTLKTIEYAAFNDLYAIKKLSIPAGVTTIGQSAFSGAEQLEEIIVESGNTKYYSSGNCLIEKLDTETDTRILLQGCNKSVLPQNDNIVTIDRCAFEDCHEISFVEIPSTVTKIYAYAFDDNYALESIVLPKVVSISNYAFKRNNKLTIVYYRGTMADWRTSVNIDTVDSGNDAITNATRYYYSENMPTTEGHWWHYVDGKPTIWAEFGSSDPTWEYIDVEDGIGIVGFDTLSATTMNIPSEIDGNEVCSIEQNCIIHNSSNITSLHIPNTITNVKIYFYNWIFPKLSSVYITDLNKFLNINFYQSPLHCAKLYLNGEIVKEVTIDQNTATGLFKGYTSLEKATITNNVQTINSSLFYGCTNLKEVVLSEGLEAIYSSAFYGCSSLKEIIIPDSVTTINSSAFYGSGLQTLYIGSGVHTIQSDAFSNISNISITFADGCNPSSLGSSLITGNASFVNMPNIKDISPFIKYANVISITFSTESQYYFVDEYAIYNIAKDTLVKCLNNKQITSFEIPSYVTTVGKYAFYRSTIQTVNLSNVTTINDYAFAYCDKINNINLSNIETIKTRAFSDCDSLTNMILSNKLKEIGDYAFSDTGLLQITVPGSVEKIGNSAFAWNRKLTKIIAEEGIKQFGIWCFHYCDKLVDVSLPSSLTNVSSYMFYDCGSLEEVIIPKNVTAINYWGFCWCRKLKKVKLLTTTPPSLDAGAFYQSLALKTIEVPKGSSELYKSATNWSLYADIIVEAE